MPNEWINTYRLLNQMGVEIVDETQTLLARRNKNASHRLSNSIDYSIDRTNRGQFVLNVSYANHGKYVLRNPRFRNKMPPVKAIEEWILMKKIPIGSGRTTNVGGKNMKPVDRRRELKSMAWAIAKSIKNRGMLNPNYTPVDFLAPFRIQKQAHRREILTAFRQDMLEQLRNNR